MNQQMKPYLEHVKGDTYCIVSGYARIPLFRLSSREAILLDSGLPREWDSICALLHKEGIRVKAALASHSHVDHVGNFMSLRREFGTELYMSLFAAAVYAEPMNRIATIKLSSTYRKLCTTMVSRFQPDHLLDWESDRVSVDGVSFDILHLPGHDAEHMGFVTPDGVAYLGDAILSAELVRALSTPYCTCIELDLASKDKIADMRYDRYILAHSGVCDEIRELAILNRDNMLRKAELIESFADRPVTLETLVMKTMEATGNDVNSIRKVEGTQHNVSVFVDYLLDMGRITKSACNGAIQYIRTDCQ